MEAREAIMLCRYVQALCPAQKFDQYTPDAWLDALGSPLSGFSTGATTHDHHY